MEDFLLREESPRHNPYLLFALSVSLGAHLLLILPRWLNPSPQLPIQTASHNSFEVRLSPQPRREEKIDIDSDAMAEDSSSVREQELLDESKDEATSAADTDEPQPAPEPQSLNMGRSIQQALENIRSAEQDYQLPGSSGSGTSAFDPNWSQRIKASDRFNQAPSPAPETFTSFTDSSGAEIVDRGNGNCLRVEPTSNLGGERAWIHVPCGGSNRLRLKPESHLDHVGR